MGQSKVNDSSSSVKPEGASKPDPDGTLLDGQLGNVGAAPPEYGRAFSIVAFATNRFVLDHVLRASRMFGNDVESLILFGTLAHLNIAHLVTPGSRPSRSLDGAGRIPDADAQLRPVRLRDLVQITGWPRETIRRKLNQLQSAGQVLRVSSGWIFRIESVGDDMRTHAVEAAQRLLQTAAVIDAAISDARRALRTEEPGGGRAESQ